MKLSKFLFGSAVYASMVAATLNAATMTFTGSTSNGRSAEADLSTSGSTLTVKLINTGSAAMVNSDTLTAVLFTLPSGISLSVGSAALGSGSSVIGSLVHNVGEGWLYESGISAFGKSSGISASGLSGVFGNTGYFYTPGQPPLDGINYGLVHGLGSGNNIPSTQYPLVSHEVDFTLTIHGGTLNLSALGNLEFVWGTSLTEGSTPGTPPPPPSVPDGGTTALLLGFSLTGIGWFARRQKSLA